MTCKAPLLYISEYNDRYTDLIPVFIIKALECEVIVTEEIFYLFKVFAFYNGSFFGVREKPNKAVSLTNLKNEAKQRNNEIL